MGREVGRARPAIQPCRQIGRGLSVFNTSRADVTSRVVPPTAKPQQGEQQCTLQPYCVLKVGHKPPCSSNDWDELEKRVKALAN
jgi:hypothetical protein